MMKIASWNVNSLRVRCEHVVKWLNENQPDVLALQEIKMETSKFEHELFRSLGYVALVNGQKTYNGVALLIKQDHTVEQLEEQIPGLDDPQRRVLAATVNGVRIINIYVPNGSDLESDKYPYKLHWLDCFSNYIEQQLKLYSDVLILGDFNIAPDDRDVHDPSAWVGQILVSEPERAAFKRLVDLGLVDAYRHFNPDAIAYSWWDYRALGFQLNKGMRIDHILVTPKLLAGMKQCVIDRAPRKWEKPSDHAPIVIE